MSLPPRWLDWLSLLFAICVLAVIVSIRLDICEKGSRLRPTLGRSRRDPVSAADFAEGLIFAHRYHV
jgi:hypothetical protein